MATKERLAKAAEEFEANPCSRESWHAACELAIDWLAERDQTPLTDSELRGISADVREKIECFGHFEAIYTVGELRTLARLAGVELKGGK